MTRTRIALLLVAIALASLAIRVWLLDLRWINPDEGAHLMDGALVLDGLVPKVDFASRQPLYVYLNAAALQLFGSSLVTGRMLSLCLSMLTGGALFLLARLLFNVHVAVLSAALYWMLPLEVLNSVVVKTEPLTALLTVLSFYGAARYWRSGPAVWMVAAGVMAALAFYVRESALIIAPAVLGFVLVARRGSGRRVALDSAWFLLGSLAIYAVVLLVYARWVPLTELPTSSISPIARPMDALRGLLREAGAASPAAGAAAAETAAWQHYREDVVRAVLLHGFLLVALLLAGLRLVGRIAARGAGALRESSLQAWALLLIWIGCLLVAYVTYYNVRGFFIDYSREFLPPLSIVCAAWLWESLPGLRRPGRFAAFLLGGPALAGIAFALQAKWPTAFGFGHHASLAIALFALATCASARLPPLRRVMGIAALVGIASFVVVSRQPWLPVQLSGIVPSLVTVALVYGLGWVLLRRGARPAAPRYRDFVAHSMVFAAAILSVTYAARLLRPAYDSIWSPESVEQVATYLREHTEKEARILSGGAVWELEAGRRPFLNLSHPLAYLGGIPETERLAIVGALESRPPVAVVLDGYTERAYLRHVPRLGELLEAEYALELEAGPARHAVRVYRRLAGGPAGD